MKLNLYLLRMEKPSYDEVESAVVAAPDAAAAYKMLVESERKPLSGSKFPAWDYFMTKGGVQKLGTAAQDIEPGVLCKHVLYG